MKHLKAGAYLLTLFGVVYGVVEKDTDGLLRLACAFVAMASAKYIAWDVK